MVNPKRFIAFGVMTVILPSVQSIDKGLLRGKVRQLKPNNCPPNNPNCGTADSGAPIPCGSETCEPGTDTPFCYTLEDGWEPRCGCENDDDCADSTNGPSCQDTSTPGLKKCGCNPVANSDGSYDGCDKHSEASYCGSAYTETGYACQCQDGSCPAGETCGRPWCVPDWTPYCSANHDGECV